ncbi:hypothetical protein ACFLY4_09775 [Chloroflexota bacterium]
MENPITVNVIEQNQVPSSKKKPNSYYRKLLRELDKNKALILEFDNELARRKGQSRIHYASVSEFGVGKVKTQSEGLTLFVWRINN